MLILKRNKEKRHPRRAALRLPFGAQIRYRPHLSAEEGLHGDYVS